LSEGQTDDGFSKERAELFEALGHPMRLEILRALSESPLGFADLKRRMNVTSSGHLTHHLEKLDDLVRTTPEGLYALTDEGKEALRIVSVSKESTSDRVQNGKKLLISRAVLAATVAALLLVAVFTGVVYWQSSIELGEARQEVANLTQQLQQALANLTQQFQQANIATYPVGLSTCSPLPSSSTPAMNLSQTSQGIRLTASLNATAIKSGQTVQVNIDALNMLPQPLKVYATLPMPVYGMDSDASGFPDFPIGIALYSGYFTCYNVSAAQPLSIHLERIYLSGSCPISGCPSLDYVVLQPSSENASATGSPYWKVQPMHLVATVSAYYTLVTSNATIPYPYPGPLTYPYNGYWQDGTPMQGTLQSLQPGTYTIAAGTTWGQLLLLYLTVE
jgi:DNA-binding transcriptional ArsR family regulator